MAKSNKEKEQREGQSALARFEKRMQGISFSKMDCFNCYEFNYINGDGICLKCQKIRLSLPGHQLRKPPPSQEQVKDYDRLRSKMQGILGRLKGEWREAE